MAFSIIHLPVVLIFLSFFWVELRMMKTDFILYICKIKINTASSTSTTTNQYRSRGTVGVRRGPWRKLSIATLKKIPKRSPLSFCRPSCRLKIQHCTKLHFDKLGSKVEIVHHPSLCSSLTSLPSLKKWQRKKIRCSVTLRPR